MMTKWVRNPSAAWPRKRRRGGFTMIEILIVVTIIGVIASIVIGVFMSAARRSRESNLRGQLKLMREAVERFQADCGAYPPALADTVAANGAAISGDQDGRGIAVDRAGYAGPYLVTGDGALPQDPFTRAVDWTYDSSTGEVHSASTLSALDGSAYTTW
jgi:prepilin-type N-terminal cleavage/methylation domain-containing protein